MVVLFKKTVLLILAIFFQVVITIGVTHAYFDYRLGELDEAIEMSFEGNCRNDAFGIIEALMSYIEEIERSNIK